MPAIPDTVKLLPKVDTALLRADLAAVEAQFSTQVNPEGDYSEEGEAGGWNVLLLRCPGGDPDGVGTGSSDTEDYADTKYLKLTPYVQKLLNDLGTPIRGVRFSSLAAGTIVGEHNDNPYGLTTGWVRLHLPVVTNDDAVLVINGEHTRWKPGEYWYGNFGAAHSISNTGDCARIHLIIDCYITDELWSVFPDDIRAQVDRGIVMYHCPEQPLPDEFTNLTGTIRVPPSFFMRHAEAPTPEEWRARGQANGEAEIRVENGRLVARVGDHDSALAHIGGGEFRFLCWTQERTIQIYKRGGKQWITFRYRNGDFLTETSRLQPSLAG